jgi:hypothetical protein
MSQQLQTLTDDMVLLFKGDMLTVAVGPVLRQTGWQGGQFVMYVPPTGVDDYLVEASDGTNIAGLLVFPSENYNPGQEETQQNYTGGQHRTEQGAASGAATVTMLCGGARCLFKYYETVSLTVGGVRSGPAITYGLNEWLRVSENGLLTNDPLANLQAAGVNPLNPVGICSAVPGAGNSTRLGIDLKF